MSLLVIEPFYGGSHAQLLDLVKQEFPDSTFVTLTSKKWHWRARTSALFFAEKIPQVKSFRKLLCSSVLNLAELVALRPDLSVLEKIVYFHENQLVYPIRERKDRDFQYGYNQVLTCLVADRVVFNSDYNRSSFLNALKSYFSITPKDQRPSGNGLLSRITSKSTVLHFPMQYPILDTAAACTTDNSLLHIVWCHRWEHDKNPSAFLRVLRDLKSDGYDFQISLLGEQYEDKPESFTQLLDEFHDRLHHVGYLQSKESYYDLLRNAHVAVSTALHEFFGVAMLEAAYCGCYPLCPNRLVYPEIFPSSCLYNTDKQLLKMLKNFCKRPAEARKKWEAMKEEICGKYSWHRLKDQYRQLLA